jgi:hypothetical protein
MAGALGWRASIVNTVPFNSRSEAIGMPDILVVSSGKTGPGITRLWQA